MYARYLYMFNINQMHFWGFERASKREFGFIKGIRMRGFGWCSDLIKSEQ